MNIYEKKRELNAKEAELRKARGELAQANDMDKIKELADKCDQISEQIDALKDDILKLEEQEQENKRSFNPMDTYGKRSFSFNGGSVSQQADGALKRGESFASRFEVQNKGLDLGKYIRGVVTGDWNGATEERNAYTTSAMGALIPAEISGRVIDYAREISIFTRAGVPIYPMKTKTLNLARVSRDPEFKFKEEGKEGTALDWELEAVTLDAKTVYGYAEVSLEAILNSHNLTNTLIQVFSSAIASSIDKGLLNGQEGEDFAPAGILNDEKINAITATNQRYDDFIKAIGAVRKNNGVPTVFALNAHTDEALSLLTDKNGVYLEAPESIKALEKMVCNQLQHDESAGSDALIFDPNALVIGLRNDITVRVLNSTSENLKNGTVSFQVYAMLDGACVQPKHVARIKGYTGVTA